MKKLLLLLLCGMVWSVNAQVHTLKESIYFGLGKTSLTRVHKDKLDSILIILKSSKSYAGEIKGYTCTIGSLSINKIISNLRALNVYNYLIDKGAIKDNFNYEGLAMANPQGDNRVASGRIKNRRADVELLLNLQDDPNKSKEVTSEYNENRKDPKQNLENANNNDYKPTVELGPGFTSGKLSAATNTRVLSTNGIVWEIDKNTFITNSKEPIEVDFKDFTQNGDIIKKGLQTKVGQDDYKLLGAFSVSFTQEYQDISINSTKPFKVYIPGVKDESMALYSNHKNWTRDSVNSLSYDENRQAYVVSVINNTQMISIMRRIPNVDDTLKYLRVKIVGLDPSLIKPYIIFDDCTISNGYRLNGKNFIFPITKFSSLYRLRASHIDYSSKNSQAYSLNYDIKNIVPVGKVKPPKEKDIIVLKFPGKIHIMNEKLPVSSLCEMSTEAVISK